MKFKSILIVVLLIFTTAVTANAHWADYYINEAMTKGIIGTDMDAVRPDDNITRGEFVGMIVNDLGLTGNEYTEFTDVDSSNLYFEAVNAAYAHGIVSGYEDGSFRPNASITREEAIAVMGRSYCYLAGYYLSGGFLDEGSVEQYARSYFGYAVRKGIITGYEDNTIGPKRNLTRAEALVMIIKSSKIVNDNIGFAAEFPKLSENAVYGKINISVKTNMPCSVYYRLVPTGGAAPAEITEKLTTVQKGNSPVEATISVDSNSEYDVYLIAQTPGGARSKASKLVGISAFSMQEGDGTALDPYIVTTQTQLSQIRLYPDKAYRLGGDIEITGEWLPIDVFSGIFDGGGNRISGLEIDSEEKNVGLFGTLKKATVKNLYVDGDVSGKSNVGIIAGYADSSTISECMVSGFAEAATNNAGGICGESTGRILNCISAVYSVGASAYSGGIAGQNYGIISDCLSAAHTVTADMYAGSVSGTNIGGRISDSLAASMAVTDVMTYNSGRITTNKKNGITENNYCYDSMLTSAQQSVQSKDNQNGLDVTWERIIDRSFYVNSLGWDFEEMYSGCGRNEEFLLPVIKSLGAPGLVMGATRYMPFRIYSKDGIEKIRQASGGNFMLCADIRLYGTGNHIPIPSFSGTLDGGGYQIIGMDVSLDDTASHYGFFGTLEEGAIVSNLRFADARVHGSDYVAVLAAENYGSISNCRIQGSITAEQLVKEIYSGSVSAGNYGIIADCEANVDAVVTAKNATFGGISAYNEGYIFGSAYLGSARIKTSGGNSTAVSGGISGYNESGYIYECYSRINLDQSGFYSYGGGICGIAASGEVYKCNSAGSMSLVADAGSLSQVYGGGICGLIGGGLCVHSFSTADLSAFAMKAYLGGISGYVIGGNLQSSYSANRVSYISSNTSYEETVGYVGGICGYNESGFISDNAALNTTLEGDEVRRICAVSNSDTVYNNYALQSLSGGENPFLDGITVKAEQLKDNEFFFKPIQDGGVLGWSAVKYEQDGIWTNATIGSYSYPVLSGVPYQNIIIR